MRRVLAVWLAVAVEVAAPAGVATARGDGPAAPPTFTITLGGRSACVTPATRGQARGEGGIIEVQSTSANAVGALLSGTAAANAYLGFPGSATETFHLSQEFELTCSDPAVSRADLTIDSALVGFVRSRHKAGAAVMIASAKVCPAGWDGSPAALSHPPLSVSGRDGKLCNQHLPPLTVPAMPLGRYVLTADLVITADAAGLADGHAVADFSPSTSLPTDWVRARDPFQGVEKKNFGFSVSLSAAPAGASTSAAATPFTRERPDAVTVRASRPASTVAVRTKVSPAGR